MRNTKSAIIHAAEQAIARAHAAASFAVAVLWQKSAEPNSGFASRVTTARCRLPDATLLIVVCGFDVVSRNRGVCVVEMPPSMLALFSDPARYRVCYGGRGAGRSWSFARALIVRSLQSRIRILCAREFQNSIADSIHTLLADQIDALGLTRYFEVQATTIYGRNGSEFIFSGIRSNVTRIKSLEGANIAFVEEAAQISNTSWEILIPTIRALGSEVWAAFNPDRTDDPTYVRFVMHPPDNAIVLKTTYADNERFPEPLKQEMEYLQRVDDDAYRHVWLGECRMHSDAQIFKNKFTVESFEPKAGWDGPYFGLDLGFSADPSVLTKCWVADNRLFVEAEAWGLHVDIDKLPNLLDGVPTARDHAIRVDSSRPETVSYLKNHGFPNTESVEKWPDSVADGISRMRAFEQIVLHPSCTHTLEEFRLYSYRVDRLTGDVLSDIVDKNNHCVDSIRYGIAPLIKSGGPKNLIAYYASLVAQDTTAKVALKPTWRGRYGYSITVAPAMNTCLVLTESSRRENPRRCAPSAGGQGALSPPLSRSATSVRMTERERMFAGHSPVHVAARTYSRTPGVLLTLPRPARIRRQVSRYSKPRPPVDKSIRKLSVLLKGWTRLLYRIVSPVATGIFLPNKES